MTLLFFFAEILELLEKGIGGKHQKATIENIKSEYIEQVPSPTRPATVVNGIRHVQTQQQNHHQQQQHHHHHHNNNNTIKVEQLDLLNSEELGLLENNFSLDPLLSEQVLQVCSLEYSEIRLILETMHMIAQT